MKNEMIHHCKSRWENSKGRLYPDQDDPYRSPYQRDRDRIIHCNAFRRIKHKTQVFIAPEGDHYRTRLTHSLEVAQIARTLARSLSLDEDLTETIALAHDIGHPPFGHLGEEVLQEKMQNFGGFNHNIQALNIVAFLEEQYPTFNGLNLTWETLDGIAKHNGPLDKGLYHHDIVRFLDSKMDLRLHEFSSLEAQIAAIADDIAYNSHDIEDGFRAGLIHLTDLKDIPYLADMIEKIEKDYPNINETRLMRTLKNRQISRWVHHILQEVQQNLTILATAKNKTFNALTCDDIRNHGDGIAKLSKGEEKHMNDLRKLLFLRVYRSDWHLEQRQYIHKNLSHLFDCYMDDEKFLPPHWQAKIRSLTNMNDAKKARIICDYIAGMTDGFAQNEYKRLQARGA